MKARGIQKVNYYCQTCEKQCRDANAFKCHMMSHSHTRQLLLLSNNPQKYINWFYKKCEDRFLKVMKSKFGKKAVKANIVYQSYIKHRQHVHMNAKRCETSTDFVKWLGREGLCCVEPADHGWYITYIDPDTITRQETLVRNRKNKAL
jgi:DNA/RNA-binding protein KIN17